MKGREGRRGGGQRGTEEKRRAKEREREREMGTKWSSPSITADWILPKNIFMALKNVCPFSVSRFISDFKQ